MKNVLTPYIRKRFFLSVFAVPTFIAAAFFPESGRLSAQEPRITVVYPREAQAVTATDSAFILGNVTPGSKLWINGEPATVYPNGAFLAFLPVQPGDFTFSCRAALGQDTALAERRVEVPPQPACFSPDSLAADTTDVAPSDSVWMRPGETLEVGIRGTPGCRAYFDIEGLAWSLPMAEKGTRTWSGKEAVFGDAAMEESASAGFYTGVYRMQPWDRAEAATVRIFLIRGTDTLKTEAPGRVTVAPAPVPVIGELTEETVIASPAQDLAYTWFLPGGTKLEVAGRAGGWAHARLGGVQDAWIPEGSYRPLPAGTPLPREIIRLVKKTVSGNTVLISIPMNDRIPFHVRQKTDPPSLVLTLYGAWSGTDWIPGDSVDPVVEGIAWRQAQDGVYELELELSQKQQWGYTAGYNGTTLSIAIKARPPVAKWPHSPLRGRVICLDPGHRPGSGAVGPTGLEEQALNMDVALELKEMLERKGTQVVMTRDPGEEILLSARPRLAAVVDADVLVSIHFNAVPDGVNPFRRTGSSTYYYHPMSRRLAQLIHGEVLKELGLPDFGLYYANLAVCRSTETVAVLTEEAFIIHPEQEALLSQPAYQKRCAKAIFKGLERFFRENR